MTGFSDTMEAGNAVAPCDDSIIPIFPMRYAISVDMLKQLPSTEAQSLTIFPTSIESHPGMELLRIRQGYVFVFSENHRGQGSEPRQIWQAFRYQTDGEDDNSSIPRADTQLQSRYSGGYNFLKYHWKDGTAAGEWEILPNERRYPYAFVSNQATTIWVGYSEYRWPAKFFERAASDVAFRERLMVRVEVQSQSGTHAAPLSRLAELAPVFRGSGSTRPPLDIETENALRHTAIETEQMDRIVHCPNSREKGVMVALKDPIGEHLDIGRLLSIHATTRAAYYAEHQYPVLIGRAVENLIAQEQVSTESIWPEWLVTVPVSTQYKAHFSQINSTLTALEASETKLIGWFNGFLGRDYDGTVLDVMTLAESVGSQYGETSLDRQDCLGFALLTFQRAFSLITGSQMGSDCALNIVGNTVQPDSATKKFTDLTQKILAQVAPVVGGSVKVYHKAFLPALEVTFTVFGKEIAQAGTRFGMPSGARTIVTHMFTQGLSNVSNAGEITNAFEQMLRNEGFSPPNTALRLPGDGGTVVSGTVPIGPHETPRIGLVTFESRIDFMVSSEALGNMNRQARIERLGNGAGSVAAFMSLYATLNNMNAGSFSRSAAGRFVDDPKIKLVTGFADAYAAVVGIYEARAIGNSAGTARALRHIFANNRNVASAVRVSVASAGRATRFLQVSGRLAGAVGIAVSLTMAFEGGRRGDQAMLVGNSLMAIGAIALLAATGVGAAIAIVVIVGGFLISLASLSDIEVWVNFSFYGNSKEYWGVVREPVSSNTGIARSLAYPDDPNHDRIRKYLDDELADYIDRTSSLSIQNATPGDGAFEVHCELIQTPADTGKVEVSVSFDRGFLSRSRAAGSIQKTFVSPGVVRVRPAPPSGDNWSNVEVKVQIARRNGGKHSESESFDYGRL